MWFVVAEQEEKEREKEWENAERRGNRRLSLDS